MKNKVIVSGVAGMAVLGALAFVPIAVNAETALRAGAANGVSTQNGSGSQYRSGNGYQASLESRAKAVNMTAEQLSEALKTKTMEQIIADQGVSTTDYQTKMREASKARWEARGLSTEEVQKRVEWQQNRQATATHDGTNHAQGGYGRQNR